MRKLVTVFVALLGLFSWSTVDGDGDGGKATSLRRLTTNLVKSEQQREVDPDNNHRMLQGERLGTTVHGRGGAAGQAKDGDGDTTSTVRRTHVPSLAPLPLVPSVAPSTVPSAGPTTVPPAYLYPDCSSDDCVSCLDSGFCGWTTQNSCVELCFDSDLHTICYDFGDDYGPDVVTAEDICSLQVQDEKNIQACQRQTDCTACLDANLTPSHPGAPSTCSWFETAVPAFCGYPPEFPGNGVISSQSCPPTDEEVCQGSTDCNSCLELEQKGWCRGWDSVRESCGDCYYGDACFSSFRFGRPIAQTCQDAAVFAADEELCNPSSQSGTTKISCEACTSRIKSDGTTCQFAGPIRGEDLSGSCSNICYEEFCNLHFGMTGTAYCDLYEQSVQWQNDIDTCTIRAADGVAGGDTCETCIVKTMSNGKPCQWYENMGCGIADDSPEPLPAQTCTTTP